MEICESRGVSEKGVSSEGNHRGKDVNGVKPRGKFLKVKERKPRGVPTTETNLRGKEISARGWLDGLV